jgi:hypothetical protein
MSDPFLDAHRVARLTYVISGPQPISIRDQMLRGALAARRLHEEREIDREKRPLVVVGAGAGGATAAIEAARIGVEAHLVEIAQQAFLTQRLARTRITDPTQYDWPLDHCLYGSFPWGWHSALPLSFRTNRADWLSIWWGWQLAVWQARLKSRLHVHFGASLVNPPTFVPSPGSRGHLAIDFGDGLINAGALIDAKGFGNEQCAVKDPAGRVYYEGQPFWGPDNFSTLQASQHTVLISGSGDGALQDYIRVLTGLNRAIEVEARLGLPLDIRHAIQSAEDRAHRGRSWSREDNPQLRSHHEGPYFRELEFEHRRMIQQALANRQVSSQLDRMFPSPPVSAALVYREPYLTCYYGLNRFITLLISEYLEKSPRWPMRTLFPSCEIRSISSSSHPCIGVPQAGRASGNYVYGVLVSHTCFGKPHDVIFKTPFCPAQRKFDVIIIRHGLVGTIGNLPFQRPRHLLPYHHP